MQDLQKVCGLRVDFFKLGWVLPKLYKTQHLHSPYRVIFTDPQGKRIYRQFQDEAKARAYHRNLLAKASIGGTAGLVLDAEMRADYFGACRLLDGVPLMTAVRYYLDHRPIGLSSTLLVDALKLFIQDKKRSGRAVRTIQSLESAVGLFLTASQARTASDYTRDAVTRYLDGLNAHPLTLRTHRGRLSVFGEWLARRQYIPENPTRYIDVTSYDPRPPRVFTPLEAETVMARAVSYRDGMFVGMFALALFAGLRNGEIQRLSWSDLRLDEKTPMSRGGAGKIRGRRAVRVVPIEPALLSWLKWFREKDIPLVNASSDARKIRDVVDWQEDIARHSWISYRLAMIGDELKVAREAGNSPDVIYRHYFQLVSWADALRYFSSWPPPLPYQQSH